MDWLRAVCSGSTWDNKISGGRETCHEAEKAHMDLAFAVLKAGIAWKARASCREHRAIVSEILVPWGLSLPSRTPCPFLPGQVAVPPAVQGRFCA